MTKLKDVVRGVEVKSLKLNGAQILDKEAVGYNSLAQAEVVVDKDKIYEAIKPCLGQCTYRWEERTPAGHKIGVVCGEQMPCPKHTNIVEWKFKFLSAIATAIESGAVLSLKKED